MARTDPLVSGAVKALKSQRKGSFKTVYNHLREARRFVLALRETGSGIRKWKNMTNKHIAAVVQKWKERGLAESTIKENLSGVRAVASFYKNDRISQRNSDFGIENRIYVDNRDKSVPEVAYKAAIEKLRQSANSLDSRVEAVLRLQHDLGMRKEEAFKLVPSRDRIGDDKILVSAGTKGGRERTVPLSPEAEQALENAEKIAGKGHNLIPPGMSERKFESYFYRALGRVGLTKAKCGASGHGLRHSYAQRRYQQVAGFRPRAEFETRKEFESTASRAGGEKWRKKDRQARQLLKSELGHGPDRDDVVAQYLGSATK